jgi:nitroreductase
MLLKTLIRKNRSYRRFHEKKKIGIKPLKGLVDLARLSGSSANLQPLKYYLSSTAELNQKIYSCLKWAGYLKNWPGPSEGERPSAYIVMLGDTRISRSFGYDAGIASQSILLGAVEKGLGGCIIGSIDREELGRALKMAAHLEILLVIALGKPKEKVLIKSVGKGRSIKYWRDRNGVHHVPKRTLEDIIVNTGK